MTTNLLIFPAEIPNNRIEANTSDTWGDTLRLNELNNNRCGPLGNLARIQTAKTGRTVLSYDMGASGAQVADHIAIARADLLQSDSVAALIVRQSEASAFAPSDVSGCVAWFDPNTGVTVDGSGGVSAWVDRVGGVSASQSTAANRPILTRYDNKENAITYSETYSNAAWNKATYPVTATDNATTNYLGASTAGKILASSGSGRRGIVWTNSSLRFIKVAASVVHSVSVDVKKSNYDYTWIGTSADSSWHGCGVNLATGAFIGSGGSVTTKTITALGSGWYRVAFTFTSVATHFPDIGIWFGSASDTTSPPSPTFAGTEELYFARPQIQRSGKDSDYLTTTATPLLAGINGNKVIHFDENNDSLTFSGTPSAMAITGDFTIFFCIKLTTKRTANSTVLDCETLSTKGYKATIFSAATGFNFRTNQAGAYTQVTSTSNLVAHETLSTYSWRSSSGTGNCYFNGAAEASGTLSASVLSNNTLTMGSQQGGGEYFGGYICEIILYNQALSSDDRDRVQNYLTAKYSTAPLVADYALAPNSGEDNRNYISTFADSSSRRYFWVEMESSASSKFTHSKLYLGDAIDFGETVDFIECIRRDDSNDDFQADSGAVDLATGKTGLYRISVTWKGITDAQLNTFLEKIAAKAELRPGLFLHTTTNHQILDGHESIYVRLVGSPVSERPKDDYNILSAEFEEVPL